MKTIKVLQDKFENDAEREMEKDLKAFTDAFYKILPSYDGKARGQFILYTQDGKKQTIHDVIGFAKEIVKKHRKETYVQVQTKKFLSEFQQMRAQFDNLIGFESEESEGE
jgi:hypothetical protein